MKKRLLAMALYVVGSLIPPSLTADAGSCGMSTLDPNSLALCQMLNYFLKDDSPTLSSLYSASDFDSEDTSSSPATLTKQQQQNRASIIAGIVDQPGKNAVPSGFSIFGGNDSTLDPVTLHSNLEKVNAAGQFVSYDQIYNPVSSPTQAVNSNSINYFSLNSIFTSQDALNYFTALMNTAVPQSIQNYHIQLANSHKSELDAHKKINFYSGNALLPTYTKMINYQNQRRRMIAFQMAALSNLEALQKMSQTEADQAKNKTLDDMLLSDVKSIGSMTSVQVARMNLLTNALILREIRKQRQIHQLMLGTLSLMLAQGNNASSSMLNMSFNDATKELEAAYGIQPPPTKMPKIPKS